MPELVYNVKFQIDTADIGQGVAPISAFKEEADQLREQLKQAAAELQRLKGGAGGVSDPFKAPTDGSNRLNSSLASTNQVLFSFSDLVQDSTQFSYGFSTGMRAIGNNVGFTAELLANLSSRVEEYNLLNKEAIAANQLQAKTVGSELFASLKGVGGALLGVNAAVLILTSVTRSAEQRIKRFADEGREMSKIYGEVASTLSDFGDEIVDPFGLRASSIELNILSKQFDQFSGVTLKNLSDSLKESGVVSFGFIGSLAVSAANILRLIPDEINRNTGAYEELEKQVESLALRQRLYTEYLADPANKAISDYVNIANKMAFELSRIRANEILPEQYQIANQSIISRSELLDNLSGQIETQSQVVMGLVSSEGELSESLMEQISILTLLTNLYNSVSDPIEKARLEVESIIQSNQTFGNSFKDINLELQTQLDRLAELRLEYPELAELILDATDATKSFSDMQKLATGADAISGLAQAAGQFGQIFNASKEFRIAMATIDAIAAVVRTFADYKFPASLAISAGIAASLAAQINSMKAVKIGSATPVSGATASGQRFGFQMNKIEGPQTFRTPAFGDSSSGPRNFNPKSGGRAADAPISVQIMADRKQLYALVKRGEEDYRQIKV